MSRSTTRELTYMGEAKQAEEASADVQLPESPNEPSTDEVAEFMSMKDIRKMMEERGEDQD